MDLARDLLSRYTQEYALDQQTRVKAEELFKEFMNSPQNPSHSTSENHLHVIMRAAILVASKCQVYKTIDNVIVRGSDLSVTQFLRGSPDISIEEFVYSLQLFIDKVKLDQIVINEINIIIRDFTLAATVFNKFEEIWQKLGIKDKSLNKAVADKLRNITWLIFIIAKVRILQRRGDLVEFAYTLVATLCIVVYHLPDDIQCDFTQGYLQVTEESQRTPEHFSNFIIEHFQTVLKAPMTEPIIISRDSILEMLIKLKQRDMIKGVDSSTNHLEAAAINNCTECQLPSKCLHGVLCSDKLAHNLKKLDSYYQQKLSPEELDERHFIQMDNRNFTPFKLSPFARHSHRVMPATPQKQSQSNDNTLEPPHKRVLHSQRLLNYDHSMDNAETITLEQKLNEIKFPQRVPNSPYSIKQTTPATPISQKMELKTWLNQNINRVSMIPELGVSKIVYDFIQQPQDKKNEVAAQVSNIIDRNIELVIEEVQMKNEGRKGDANTKAFYMRQYGSNVKQLTFRILDELLIKESRAFQGQASMDFTHLLTKEIFLKSVFVCAMETVLFIGVEKYVQIHDILALVDLKSFDFWRLLNSFLKFDPQMPRTLNIHFREMEIRIVSETAWTYGSPIVEVIQQVQKLKDVNGKTDSNEEQKIQDKIIQSYHMFFKRVLHLASQRILELGEALQLSEEVLEKIWAIMKIQLSTEPQLLINRHLDQLVMCTIYYVCKVQPQLQITFNNIINKYADLNRHVRNFHSIYLQVTICGNEKKDVIHFYNEVYIKVMKEYIHTIKDGQSDAQTSTQLGSRTPVINRKPMLTPSINKPQIKVLCPQSPLKQNLPPQMMQYNTIFQQNPRSNLGTPLIGHRFMASPLQPHMMMTPRTHQLYAFGETPSGELDKISSMFGRAQQNSQNNTGRLMQPPPFGGLGQDHQAVKNSFLQSIKGKATTTTNAPEPTVKRSLPTLGASQEPKVMGFGQLGRKKSDQIMSEPPVLPPRSVQKEEEKRQ